MRALLTAWKAGSWSVQTVALAVVRTVAYCAQINVFENATDYLQRSLGLTTWCPIPQHTTVHTQTHNFYYLHLLLLQVALQPGVGLGLRYNMPPGLSVPCSISPFVYTHLSQVHGHVIQSSHSRSSSSSCCIQFPHSIFFWDCGTTCI